MPVGGLVELDLQAVSGVRLGTSMAGIRQTERDDLTVFEISAGSQVAATFTKNRFCAAPVTLAKKHLLETAPRYLLINSGNANAGLGDLGLLAAEQCCSALADLTQSSATTVLPFSTGVIGEPLPVDKLIAGLGAAIDNLAEDHWENAAQAIMTTDTCPKGCSKTFQLEGETVTITGIAKGSGMIRPDMATMLQQMLAQAVALSFNSITVDGDTSTNDAVVLIATAVLDCQEIQSCNDVRKTL